MWMKKAEFGLGNKTIVGSCSNSLRNTNPRGRIPSSKFHIPSNQGCSMNDLYAIIPSSVLILLIAIRKIMIPIKFNEGVYGEIHPDEVHNSATMRMLVGAGFGSVGLKGLS
jgi:hypothetical protein